VAVFDPLANGTGIQPGKLAIMIAWGLVGVAIALRRFQWEPRRT